VRVRFIQSSEAVRSRMRLVQTSVQDGRARRQAATESISGKRLKNWLIFGEVVGKSLVSCFSIYLVELELDQCRVN